jgi:hypothetical protein
MTVLTESMNYSSTAGLVAQPAYRRFLSDMTDERGVIPQAMLRYPELAALEEQRRRLVQALTDANAPTGSPQMSEEQYIAARAKALREGTDLPAPPPSQSENDAVRQQRQRDVQAATDALLALADDICQTVREHPAFEQDGREHIVALREQAADLRRQAEAAEREAEAAGFLVLWLERVAHDELFVVNQP